MSYVLEVDSLQFRYDEDLILKNISFSIQKGEFVSIIGPNGSGKSTLLKNLCNICKPSQGILKIDDVDVEKYKVKELARKIALVPQDTSIAYDFSVFDVVLMGRNPYIGRFEKEKDSDFEITKEALKATNTFHLRDRNINEISGGERQRVIIARALTQQPDIIFLDEPTSHLDINHQIEILSLLRKLNREKETTIVLVIHDINLASRYSDKIILMNNGEILSMGSPKEVITRSNIEKAYDLNVIVEENPYTDSLFIVPLSLKGERKKTINKRVHVISGGGTGGEILSKLEETGCFISAGVINVGDTDWELAKKLSLNIVEEKPFTGISQEAFRKNMEFIKKTDLIVLSSTPYGKGNMKNLEAAYLGLKMGKSVYLVDNCHGYCEYDYTGGEAVKIIDKMKEEGLTIVDSIDTIINTFI